MNQLFNTCPFKKVTIKHGTEPDRFSVFKSTFTWCMHNSKEYFKVSFIDDTTVAVEFMQPAGAEYLVNVLTEYIARHTFVKAIDEIVKQTEFEISEKNKELAYTMCVNIVESFIQSASILMNWSLNRFFQNNDTINITLYEKLNLKPLRDDFDAILKQPHALNYVFDSFERVMATNGTKDEKFLLAGLTTKSKVEDKSVFAFQKQALHIWMNNGKISFGNKYKTFGVKEILCKELYANGFNPQIDMTCVKIVGLAILFCCPQRVVLHRGFENRGIEEFIKKYQGVFGELDFMYANTLIPNFDEDEEFEDEEDYEE